MTRYPVVVFPLNTAAENVKPPIPALLVSSYCFPTKRTSILTVIFTTTGEIRHVYWCDCRQAPLVECKDAQQD